MLSFAETDEEVDFLERRNATSPMPLSDAVMQDEPSSSPSEANDDSPSENNDATQTQTTSKTALSPDVEKLVDQLYESTWNFKALKYVGETSEEVRL